MKHILGDSDINSIRYCEPHGIPRRSVNRFNDNSGLVRRT